MTIDRFSATACSTAVIGVMLATQPLAAQQYPSQPITIIVAAAAGGFADGVARAVGERLSEKLGQSIVIENRGGAAGNLGARAVATAKPDGHTVLVSTTSMAINDTLYKNMGYRTEDITPAAIVGSAPEAIVVNPANPAKNLREFLEAARQKPVEYGSAGVGSGSFIAAEYLFKVIAKTQTVHVPFPAARPPSPRCWAITFRRLLRRCHRWSTHIQSGKVAGHRFASAKRHPVVPHVPPTPRAGLPISMRHRGSGSSCRPRRPTEDRGAANAAINEVVKLAAVQQRLSVSPLSRCTAIRRRLRPSSKARLPAGARWSRRSACRSTSDAARRLR